MYHNTFKGMALTCEQSVKFFLNRSPAGLAICISQEKQTSVTGKVPPGSSGSWSPFDGAGPVGSAGPVSLTAGKEKGRIDRSGPLPLFFSAPWSSRCLSRSVVSCVVYLGVYRSVVACFALAVSYLRSGPPVLLVASGGLWRGVLRSFVRRRVSPVVWLN